MATRGGRDGEPADGDNPEDLPGRGDHEPSSDTSVDPPPQPHSEGPAAALIRCTKQVFRNTESLGDVPLFVICLTVSVRHTAPLFYKHMKYPHSPQQALEALSRISFYKDAMAHLLSASALTGNPIREEFDKYIAAIWDGPRTVDPADSHCSGSDTVQDSRCTEMFESERCHSGMADL